MAENDQNIDQEMEEDINLDDFSFEEVIDFDPADEDYIPEPIETGTLEESMTDIDDLLGTTKEDDSLEEGDDFKISSSLENEDFAELVASAGEEYTQENAEESNPINHSNVEFDDWDEEEEIDSEIDKYLKEPDREIDKDELLLKDKSFLDFHEDESQKNQSEIIPSSYNEIDDLLDAEIGDTPVFTDQETSTGIFDEPNDDLSIDLGSFQEDETDLSDQELGDFLGADTETESMMGDDFDTLSEENAAAGFISENIPPSMLDENEEESISLSADELEGFGTEMDLQEDFSDQTADSFLSEDEEIGLSDSELGSLLTEDSKEEDSFLSSDDLSSELINESENEHEEKDFPTSILDEEENEPIALSLDELENIGADAENANEDLSLDYGSFQPEEEDISLSDAELGGLLEVAETEESSEIGSADFLSEEEELGSYIGEVPESKPSETSFIDTEEDESISLSMDELENIGKEEDVISSEDLNFVDEEEIGLSPSELDDLLEVDEGEPESLVSDLMNEGPSDLLAEEETIALSPDELENIDLDSGKEDELLADYASFDSEEEIGLSDEELGDLLDAKEEESTIHDDVDEEPIALSREELENLGADLSSEEDAGYAEDTSFLTEEDEVGLSDSELSDLLENEEELSSTEHTEESSLLDDDSEEPITLSLDELENIGVVPENTEDSSASPSDLTEESLELSNEKLLNLLDSDESDEPVALSLEELDQINAIEAEDNIEDSLQEPESIVSLDDLEVNPLDELDSSVEELSSEELDQLLGENIPGETLESKSAIVEETEAPKEQQIETDQFFNVTDFPLTINMDEYAREGEKSLAEKVHNIPEPVEEQKNTSELSLEGISKVEMKEMMGYLDNLLGSLPDDSIREFSRSSYFNLYKKLMQDIGL